MKMGFGVDVLFRLYRWLDNDWQKIGGEMFLEIIWVDLFNVIEEEKKFVE